MKQLIFLLFAIGLSQAPASAQSRADSLPAPQSQQFRKIIGLNMTPLVTQLIPLNRSNAREAGPFLLRFKTYGRRNRVAFRFSLGVHIVPDENSDFDNPQLNIAMGWEKRRSLGGRWAYTRGFDLLILAGDLNTPGSTQDDETIMLGGGPVWGIEYFFDRRISIGTEATLAMGFSPDIGVVMQIIPPVGIFLNHYF